jgi:hypothetical protein
MILSALFSTSTAMALEDLLTRAEISSSRISSKAVSEATSS